MARPAFADDDDRRAYYRALGSRGGRATVAKHGPDHMARIGRAGFAAAIESIGGVRLAAILGASYRAKFGRDFDIARAHNRAAARERAATRAAYPTLGRCESPGCLNAATDRHHAAGIAAGHDRRVIGFLCGPCHRAHHADLRAARRRTKPIRRGDVRRATIAA